MTGRVLPLPDPGHSRDGDADEPLLRDLIGEVLRRTRLQQRRTLRDVAEQAQVSLPYLSEVERGRKELSSEILAAIRRALGLSVEDLTGMLHMQVVGNTKTLLGTSESCTRPSDGSSADNPTMLLAA